MKTHKRRLNMTLSDFYENFIEILRQDLENGNFNEKEF